MKIFFLGLYCFYIYSIFAHYTILSLGCNSIKKSSIAAYLLYVGIVELVLYVCGLSNNGNLTASMVLSAPLCYVVLYDRLKHNKENKGLFINFIVELAFSIFVLMVLLYIVFNEKVAEGLKY